LYLFLLDGSGVMELKPVNGGIPRFNPQQRFFAIRGPNLSTEFMMLGKAMMMMMMMKIVQYSLSLLYTSTITLFADTLQSIRTPLLPVLLTGHQKESTMQAPPISLEIDRQRMYDMAEEFINLYRLNDDQALVLRRLVSWFDGDRVQQQVVLVHGVFGSVWNKLEEAEVAACGKNRS
jgi:hypothetical protein